MSGSFRESIENTVYQDGSWQNALPQIMIEQVAVVLPPRETIFRSFTTLECRKEKKKHVDNRQDRANMGLDLRSL